MKTAPATRSQGRILVVEDERDVAELIRYHLGREGYDVLVAATGADAVKQAREARPDIVLLDIMVPQLNGWEVCRRLKQDAATRSIPVIMVTGRAEEGDKVLGFELGAPARQVHGGPAAGAGHRDRAGGGLPVPRPRAAVTQT